MVVRHALTFAECLVVFVIVAILLSLLLMPTYEGVRTARRNRCSVNLRNHSLAMIQHEHARGHFPGYLQSFGFYGESESRTDPTRPLISSSHLRPHRKLSGWAVAVLPWLEAQPTYEHWSEDRYPVVHFGTQNSFSDATGFTSFAAPNLAIFQCPSDPSDLVTQAT